MLKADPDAKADPPDDTLYHCIPDPLVVVKSATVEDTPVQKVCVALAVGADGVVLTVKVLLVEAVHPLAAVTVTV